MGFDLEIIPVRLAAAPTQRIRTDPDAWDQACVHPPFGTCRAEPRPAISFALTAEVPDDIGDYAPFPYRGQNQAEYLLDPALFGQPGTYEIRERTIPYRIIFGDEFFAEHARSSQGFPWRCSTAAFLRQAAATIDSLDTVAARHRFSAQEMLDLHVYKAPVGGEDDEQFDQLLQSLRNLSTYYRTIADRGLDAMVILI